MTDESIKKFNARHPQKPVYEEPPARKRSSQIALLLMGTMAVGGGAYALMPSENCDPNKVIVPGQPAQECRQRSSSWSSSSGGHGYYGGSSSSSARSNFSGSSAAAASSSAGTSTSSVARSGFGSFGSHFSAAADAADRMQRA